MAARLARTVPEPELKGIDAEIDRDYATLQRLMDDLGVTRSRLKQLTGVAAEMASRVKLRLGSAGAHDVGQLLGLEAMAVGVAGELGLWRSLQLLTPSDPRLDEQELPRLRPGRSRSSTPSSRSGSGSLGGASRRPRRAK